MTSKGVIENINEFLSVVDPLTKGIIYCVNRNLLRKQGWCKQWLGIPSTPEVATTCNPPSISNDFLAVSSNEIKLIDVTETIPYSSKKAFTHDTFVDIGDEDTFIDLLIDFACMIHEELVKSGRVVINCKNGRSRSPQVILAFMMLRGIPREHCIQWLTLAFRSQRPTITRKSAEFPNFPKFHNVTVALEQRCIKHRSDIENRVRTNIPSSCASSANVYLSGEAWTGQWGKPINMDFSRSATSFCPAPGSLSSSSSVTSTETGRRSKRVKRSKAAPDINIHTAGRRVKVLVDNTQETRKRKRTKEYKVGIETRKRKRTIELIEYKVGTLLYQNITTNKWQIAFDDHTMEEVESKHIEVAFPKGTRVQVNWQGKGHFDHGVVSEWNGGESYGVWYDLEKRSMTTPGSEMFSSTKPLPALPPSAAGQSRSFELSLPSLLLSS